MTDYSCGECGTSYLGPRTWKAHMRYKHGKKFPRAGYGRR